MNDYGARLAEDNGAQLGVGSVRRARERMEAGASPGMPPGKAGYEQRANALSPPMNRKQMQQDTTGSSIGETAIGVAISRPIPVSQSSQWPLMDANVMPQQFASDPAYRPPPGRAVAPQRPPRPSRGPSILEPSQPQEPFFAYNQPQKKGLAPPQYADEDLFSPNSVNPRSPETPSASSSSGSSRPSTIGTIPDFPLPVFTQGGRRSGNLGPPPSARRGASSYYSSHASYVSPIPEESPRTQRSHSSYASSAAIPSSWGSASPEYYYDGEQSPDDDRGIMSEHGIIEEGRESRESNYDGNEEQSLVRQASVGKRGKPSLINTKSTENMDTAVRAEPPAQSVNNPPEQEPAAGLWGLRESRAPEAAMAAAIAAGFATAKPAGSRETVWPAGDEPDPTTIPNIPPDPASYDANRPSSEWDDPTTASSETVPSVGRALSSSSRMSYPQSREPVPPIPDQSDPRVNQILGAHEAASAINPQEPTERIFSRLSAIRRPPRLDIDAVRNAEARGSLTSLPDLIKRATRLAAMMDKGRRPASRFDWSTSPGGKSMVGVDRYQRADVMQPGMGMEMQSGTIGMMPVLTSRDLSEKNQLGDMLAAFPAPGATTPTREVEGRPPVQSPKFLNEKSSFDVAKDQQRGNKQRRCCGLPLCGFLLIIIVVLLAVVAGIAVPIELLVVHKSKPTASTQLTLASCIAEVTCLNGGKNDISSGVCSCICVNGFTGATCASDADTVGCATADIAGTTAVNNVTLGSSLGRLIAKAETNFSIPLTSNVILSKLNTANVSCVSQNSLVTFNGASNRGAISEGSVVLPVVQAVGVGIAIPGVQITLTVAGGGNGAATTARAASSSVTIDLEGTSTQAGVTVPLGSTTAEVTVPLGSTTATPSVTVSLGSTTRTTTASSSSTTATSSSSSRSMTSNTAASTTASSATASATSTASFAASQQMLDFARVAVLYVLQQETLGNAATAQSDIQQFLSSSTSTTSAAQNVTMGNGNTIDFINFAVNVGNGTVGSLSSTASKRKIRRNSHPHHLPAF